MPQFEEQEKLLYDRLRAQEKKLPSFVFVFFRAIESNTSINTRLGYAYDLGIFFYYLVNNEDEFLGRDVKSLNYEDLNNITIDHLERYISFLRYYAKPDGTKVKEYTNKERGLSRKISAVRSMLKYFYKKGVIKSNQGELIIMPKIKDKAILGLNDEEVSHMLDVVETGVKSTNHEKQYHEKTKERDLAIITLFLGTGIRISELVGLDINHINFDSHYILITRKGGDEQIIYYGDEVSDAMIQYYELRKQIIPQEYHENAFFLSMQNRRITQRAVQNLVKKYANEITRKKITPHKLRSTYGSKLYSESRDIYLVASVLGHKDINTTRKHYATMNEEIRKTAPGYITLRDEE